MQGKRSHSGFTLLELLIAVALVAVVVVLAFPVMARIRSASNDTRCLDNLRKLGVACFSYAAEHQQQLPFRYVVGGPYSGYGSPLWYLPLAPYLGLEITDKNAGEISPPGVLACPADAVPWVGSVTARPTCSYAFPITLPSRNPDGTPNESGSYVNLLTRFYDRSATVMLIDSAYANVFNIYNYSTVGGSANDREETGQKLVQRHRGVLNAVFADGHVEPVPGTAPSFDPKRPHLWGNQPF